MTPAAIGDVTKRAPGLSRRAGLGVVAGALISTGPVALLAQTRVPGEATARSTLAVPTTKLVAIGSFNAKAAPDVWMPILPAEMRATAQLYLAGKIDQWYVKQDQTGVVFIMGLTDPREAHDLLARLPLGQAGLMDFEIIPVGPLSPLRALLSEPQD
jgi:hypothetical protein